MLATRPEFSEATLTQLLRSLRARTSRDPDNPGVIASWPGVREDRIAAACAELLSRGHPVFRVSIPSANPGKSRRGLVDPRHGRGAGAPSVIVVAESDTGEPSAFSHDRRSFQLKERVTSSNLSDPYETAQLIQRLGWALAHAEGAERAASR